MQNEDLKALVEDAKNILETVEKDTVKFTEKGNKAAGTRVRTGSMELIKKLKEIRTAVSDIKNQG